MNTCAFLIKNKTFGDLIIFKDNDTYVINQNTCVPLAEFNKVSLDKYKDKIQNLVNLNMYLEDPYLLSQILHFTNNIDFIERAIRLNLSFPVIHSVLSRINLLKSERIQSLLLQSPLLLYSRAYDITASINFIPSYISSYLNCNIGYAIKTKSIFEFLVKFTLKLLCSSFMKEHVELSTSVEHLNDFIKNSKRRLTCSLFATCFSETTVPKELYLLLDKKQVLTFSFFKQACRVTDEIADYISEHLCEGKREKYIQTYLEVNSQPLKYLILHKFQYLTEKSLKHYVKKGRIDKDLLSLNSPYSIYGQYFSKSLVRLCVKEYPKSILYFLPNISVSRSITHTFLSKQDFLTQLVKKDCSLIKYIPTYLHTKSMMITAIEQGYAQYVDIRKFQYLNSSLLAKLIDTNSMFSFGLAQNCCTQHIAKLLLERNPLLVFEFPICSVKDNESYLCTLNQDHIEEYISCYNKARHSFENYNDTVYNYIKSNQDIIKVCNCTGLEKLLEMINVQAT